MRTIEAALAAFNACSKLRRAEIEAIASESNPDEIWAKEPPPPDPPMTEQDWAKWDAWCDAEDAKAHMTDDAVSEAERYEMARLTRANPHDD